MKLMKLLFFGLLALPVIVSCDNDDASLTEIADPEIAVGLSLDNRISSRASVAGDVLDAENYIVKGDYGIILDLEPYANQAHCCRFGTSILDKGRRGNIYIVTDGEPGAAPLKWSNVGVDSLAFAIDNIGYKEECSAFGNGFLGREWSDYEKTVTYGAQKEQYDDAGIPKHTNDIIWGAGMARKGKSGGREVSYAELTHRMTRVSVAFVNLTEQQQKDMDVSLTNLVLAAESFNRADGTVAIAADPDRSKPLVLLDHEKDDKLDLIRDETAEGTYLEHVTANYILPPQSLTDDHWPEIVVTYTDENNTTREVRGLIPHDVLNEDGNNWEGLNGLNAGNHLTIVAEIKDNIPDIVFTAKVRKWVDLGTSVVTASQDPGTPGIRSKEELEHCISLYNDLPQFNAPDSWDYVMDYNKSMRLKHFGELMKYGDCEFDGRKLKWKFYIKFPLTVSEMPETGFRYMLCQLAEYPDYTYPLELVDQAGSSVDVNELRGKQGIYNMEDLNHMIMAVNERDDNNNPNLGFMLLYGTTGELYVPTYMYTYTINIRDSFNGDLLYKLNLADLKYYGVPVKVIVNFNGFKVNGSDNVDDLIGI